MTTLAEMSDSQRAQFFARAVAVLVSRMPNRVVDITAAELSEDADLGMAWDGEKLVLALGDPGGVLPSNERGLVASIRGSVDTD